MKTLILILALCVSAFCASFNTHDSVFVEQVIRDTVYIPIKSRTDTVIIKKEVSLQKQDSENKCCKPTEENPFGLDTTKYLRNDTSYTHHPIYLNFDLVSVLWMLADSSFTTIGGNLEVSLSRKNSIILLYRYSKIDYGHDTLDIYNGTITQHDIGMGYRHYFRPAKYSFYLDIGGFFLIRKYDYINTWDNTNLINERPHSRHDNGYYFAPYLHAGHIFRGKFVVVGIEYGMAYNSSSDKELLKNETSYITGGAQFDFRLNIGLGIL